MNRRELLMDARTDAVNVQYWNCNTTLGQPPLTGFLRITRRLGVAFSGHTDVNGVVCVGHKLCIPVEE
jgi:hypothetical protein